jgi:hypothetical protein
MRRRKLARPVESRDLWRDFDEDTAGEEGMVKTRVQCSCNNRDGMAWHGMAWHGVLWMGSAIGALNYKLYWEEVFWLWFWHCPFALGLVQWDFRDLCDAMQCGGYL